jgi:abortive infection bacteriophage resistance protein
MRIPYTKTHLDVSGQLSLLQSRGMIVSDPAKASSYLERIGYYRLSGYWYPFRQVRLTPGQPPGYVALDDFRPGTEFSKVIDLYVFDKRLRLLFLDAIERLEVGLRVGMAMRLGARSPWAHRDPSQLYQRSFVLKRDPRTGLTGHEEWLAKRDREALRSKEEFVKHFTAKYSDPLPVWIDIELWDFGALSTLFGNLDPADVRALAAKYNVSPWQLLSSWVRSINLIRNICAHHARLWNRSVADMPKIPSIGDIPLLDHLVSDRFAQTRIYAPAAVTQYLLQTINPGTSWGTRLKAHLATFPTAPGVTVSHTGFPTGWEALTLWN